MTANQLKEEAQRHLPLTPIAFEILLTLARGARHGYAIMLDIDERTGGAMKAHAGTLYRAVSRMVDAELVEELTDAPAGVQDDARRRYYALTPLGRAVAAAEAARLEDRVAAARAARLLRRTLEA